MIPKIKEIRTLEGHKLYVSFDSNETVIYDVSEDIRQLKDFRPLETEPGLFNNFQIDPSRTCVSWSDRIDLPSDTLLEYGQPLHVAGQ